MTYPQWTLDAYPRIRKRSTVHEYKRVFAMLYRNSVGQSLHDQVNEELNDVSQVQDIEMGKLMADGLLG